MKTIVTLLLMLSPAVLSAETFGLGESATVAVSTSTAETFGLGSVGKTNAFSPQDTVCYIGPDGQMVCLAPPKPLTKPVPKVQPRSVPSNYNARWTVAGGQNNIVNHMAGWPHNKDVAGMSRGEALALHDADHDRIGPVSGQQLAAMNGGGRYVQRDCPTCPSGRAWVWEPNRPVMANRPLRSFFFGRRR